MEQRSYSSMGQNALLPDMLHPSNADRVERRVHTAQRLDQQQKAEVSRLLEPAPSLQPVSQAGLGNQFSYTPHGASLTIGQNVELWPKLSDKTARYHVQVPLPAGLTLDMSTGVIHGCPLQAALKATSVIQATLSNGVVLRTALDFEVIDFTRGDFVIGHISEIEQGKFMLLLYVPDGSEEEQRHAAEGIPLAGFRSYDGSFGSHGAGKGNTMLSQRALSDMMLQQ
jgi:hypothetical protein